MGIPLGLQPLFENKDFFNKSYLCLLTRDTNTMLSCVLPSAPASTVFIDYDEEFTDCSKSSRS